MRAGDVGSNDVHTMDIYHVSLITIFSLPARNSESCQFHVFLK